MIRKNNGKLWRTVPEAEELCGRTKHFSLLMWHEMSTQGMFGAIVKINHCTPVLVASGTTMANHSPNSNHASMHLAASLFSAGVKK